MSTIMIIAPTNPPTTPPTIAPVLSSSPVDAEKTMYFNHDDLRFDPFAISIINELILWVHHKSQNSLMNNLIYSNI